MQKLSAPTKIRLQRLACELKLSDVAARARVSLGSASIAERDPENHPEHAEALRLAIEELARERGIAPPASVGDGSDEDLANASLDYLAARISGAER